ncbi:unnamed protein product [Clavelina lepadiformis]|uniref:Uncharacterized protein n=1 Tax=Clavelina lepadiformis TaxID=159417 RepID=A0ABP0FC67_CLALP
MAAQSAFRLSINEKTSKAALASTGITKGVEVDSTLHANCPIKTPNFLWQNLSPELRAEAIRRAQLVQLFKQVNPDLQLCRRSTSDAAVQAKPTLEKGIQVPDIRFDYGTGRKFKPRNVTFGGFVGPGIRIQPRQRLDQRSNNTNYVSARQIPRFPLAPINASHNRQPWMPPYRSTLRVDAPPHTPRNVRIQASPTDKCEPTQFDDRRAKLLTASSGGQLPVTELKQTEQADTKTETEKENINRDSEEDEKVEADQKSKDDKISKTRSTSSGDEDSVVVVLDEPKKDRDLEKKYGQFFCRRCLRGWTSRNVWCVRDTCKVYIKQTCNMCNKVVNPYLVCHLPTNPQKHVHWRSTQSELIA